MINQSHFWDSTKDLMMEVDHEIQRRNGFEFIFFK